MKKIIYIGYEYSDQGKSDSKSLDIKFFIDSINQIDDFKAEGVFIDSKKNKEREKFIIKNVERISPDLILTNIIKDELSNYILNKLSEKYTTVNWFGDDQWRFNNFSKNKAKYFKYIITTDKKSINKYKIKGINNVIYSQWAAVKVIDRVYSKVYKYDISFVGSYSPAREWVINNLKSKNLNVEVFGYGWPKAKELTYDEILDVFSMSKINLNLSNSVPSDNRFLLFSFSAFNSSVKNIFKIGLIQLIKDFIKLLKNIKFFFLYEKRNEQIKARNFEIPSASGFQISSYVEEINEYFIENESIILFKTIDELVSKCNFFLKNDLERETIKQKGFLISKNHTYTNRMNKVLNLIFNKHE